MAVASRGSVGSAPAIGATPAVTSHNKDRFSNTNCAEATAGRRTPHGLRKRLLAAVAAECRRRSRGVRPRSNSQR